MIILFIIIFIAILDDSRPYATEKAKYHSNMYIAIILVLGMIATGSALTI